MIIKLEPIAFEKVWGGNAFSTIYNINKRKIGEIWGISAHKSASNIIRNGDFKGKTLRMLYNDHKELFGNLSYEEFPILFKVIDADYDLSIQVHPNDEYAMKYENSKGKDECWYVLETRSEDASIIIGHNAKSKEELKSHMNGNKFELLLNRYLVKPKDYFYIQSGKIHAICKDTMLLEVSQSSDVTYRLYDYDRLDNGKLRVLHIDKSLDVINIPDSKLQTHHINKYFTFEVKENSGFSSRKSHVFGDYYYIIDGKGTINNEIINKGDFLIVTSNEHYLIKGCFNYVKVTII